MTTPHNDFLGRALNPALIKGQHRPLPGYTATFSEFMQHCWPEFTILHACILLPETNYAYFFQLIQSKNHSLSTIEIELNKRRIIDLLPANAPINVEQVTAVGKQIQNMWQAKLETSYPDDKFSVIFYEGKSGNDIENFEITFFKIRW
ncbi:MAG: hypothetical protein AAF633_18445 [Chloroflexota bacterium]